MSEFTRFIVDKILPTNTLHAIYGPSGAGRTSLLLQIMDDWRQGLPVFGHTSYPLPFVFLSTVESDQAIQATLLHKGYDPSLIPHTSLLHAHKREEHTIEGALRRARAVRQDLQVLFIDGMTSLCTGNIAIYREASVFLLAIHDLCLAHNITIVGTTSCGKSDDENVRNKPLGSIAWNDHSSTRIIIDYAKPGKLDCPDRTIHLIPRHSHTISYRYSFDPETKRLVENSAAELGVQLELDDWLSRQQPGAELTTMDILVAATQFGLSRATAYRWIQDSVELGQLTKVKHGIYTRPPLPEPKDIN